MADGELIEVARRIADLIEGRIAPALERIADALAQRPIADDPRREALGEIRRALRHGRWAEADELARDFEAEHPDAPETAGFDEAIRAGKAGSAATLRAQMDAAHQAGDAERILALRGELAALLEPGPLAELDRETLACLMALIQKRLRVIPIPTDLPALVARVSDSYATTPEGASLRRALPTLRRSAGLCPRCEKPYRGTADACAECLATPPAAGS